MAAATPREMVVMGSRVGVAGAAARPSSADPAAAPPPLVRGGMVVVSAVEVVVEVWSSVRFAVRTGAVFSRSGRWRTGAVPPVRWGGEPAVPEGRASRPDHSPRWTEVRATDADKLGSTQRPTSRGMPVRRSSTSRTKAGRRTCSPLSSLPVAIASSQTRVSGWVGSMEKAHVRRCDAIVPAGGPPWRRWPPSLSAQRGGEP